jgi:hypothetical protein
MKSVRVTYTDKDGKECAVIVRKPTHTQLTEANLYAASIFNRARQTGVCLRGQIDDWLEEQNIWTKDDRKKMKELDEKLQKKITLLSTGKTEDGKNMKLSEARKLALDIRMDRWRLNIMQIQRREYDAYTVEGQTENARFDCLASLCILDEEGNRLFKSVDDYYDNGDEQYVIDAASKLANIMFGHEDWEKGLEENMFLRKHNLINDKGQLIGKNGELVDVDGNPIQAESIEQTIQEPTFEDDIH